MAARRHTVLLLLLSCSPARASQPTSLHLIQPESLPLNLAPVRVLATAEGPVLTFCSSAVLVGQPTELVPFYDNLLAASGCYERPENVLAIKVDELLPLLEEETPRERWTNASDGFIVHAMRVGSTAVANLLGGHPKVVALKEPGALSDLLDLHGEREAPGLLSQIVRPPHPLHGRLMSQVVRLVRAVLFLFRRAAEAQVRGWVEANQR